MTTISLESKFFRDLESSMHDGIVKDRVFYLLKWYRKKAVWDKTLTYIATAFSILLPAILTLLNISAVSKWLGDDCTKCLQAALPVIGSASAGFYAFLRSRENWIRYRTTVEQLKRETVRYAALYGVGNARDAGAEEEFLAKIEEICALEFSEWQNIRMEATVKEEK